MGSRFGGVGGGEWCSLTRAVGVSIAVLVVAGCGVPEAAEEAKDEAAAVATVRVTAEPIDDRMSLPVDLLPWRRARLAAEVPGVVESIAADLGDEVGRGQVLATINRSALEQDVKEAEAVARQRELQLQRAQGLFEKRSITQAQLLDAVTNQDVAQSRLATARLQLQKSQVRAPFAGRVAEREVERGDFASVGQPLFELVDVSRLRARVPVAAADVPAVELGSSAELVVPGVLAEPISVTVERASPELDPLSRTLTVEAEVPGDLGIRPGQPARLRLLRRHWEKGLLVPMEAIVDLGASKAVYVVTGGMVERREVTLGPVIDDRILVAEGLEDGAEIIVRGQGQVAPGQAVKAVPLDQADPEG